MTEMNVMQFGDRLRLAREKAGLTQMDVASAMYTSQAMISRYESGSVMLKIDRVTEMADMYGVSIDWLCGRNE
jgi:transcriptional regulator with XRE-family HTH domain